MMEIGHSFITLAGTGLILGKMLDWFLARLYAKRMANLTFKYYDGFKDESYTFVGSCYFAANDDEKLS